MEREKARKIIEALLYMTDHPLSEKEIVDIIDSKSVVIQDVKEISNEIAEWLDRVGSPLFLARIAGGVQFATRPEMAPWIRRLYKDRLTVRLSQSALETLSIIAYKQPISRSELEQIRGVEVTAVMDTLLERRLIKVVGRKETIGRPLLYGTTSEFLRQFGLNNLTELPDLATLPEPEPALIRPSASGEEVLVPAFPEETATGGPPESGAGENSAPSLTEEP